MKIIISALLLAVSWTISLALIAHSYGLHSGPGIWAGVFGLPGVVAANWIQSTILHDFNTTVAYWIMFLVNWIFYCTVIQGLISMKRSFWT